MDKKNYSLQHLIETIFEIGHQFHPDSFEADLARISWIALGLLEDYLNKER